MVTEGRPGWVHKPVCVCVHVVCVSTHMQAAMAGVPMLVHACASMGMYVEGTCAHQCCVHGCVCISLHAHVHIEK